jgi:uncharacterized membrane protein YgcG
MVSTPIFECISMILIGLIFITIASILKKKSKKRRSSYLSLIVRVFLAVFMVLFLPTTALAYSAKIGWNPNDDPDLEGYILYGSEDSPCPPYYHIDTYPEKNLANPLYPKVKITDLDKDITYYFVLTAYNKFDYESDYSNVLSVLNGQGENAICISEKGGSGGGGGGGSGGGGGG